MIKKVLFTVSSENMNTSEERALYSCLKNTTLSLEEIENRLDFSDGYKITVIDGNIISFVDLTCFWDISKEAIWKIETIPATEEEPEFNIQNSVLFKISSQSNDDSLVRHKNELVYKKSRFECGASGYGEFIAWAPSCPLATDVISGLICDCIIILVQKICRLIFGRPKSSTRISTPQYICFSPKQFHRHFSKVTGLKQNEFQITEIGKEKNGVHNIKVRTAMNTKYNVKANRRGRVLEYKLIGSTREKTK